MLWPSHLYIASNETAQKQSSSLAGYMILRNQYRLRLSLNIFTHAGLFMINTIMLREHNRVCDILKEEYPEWEDEQLYQTAKNIIAGI